MDELDNRFRKVQELDIFLNNYTIKHLNYYTMRQLIFKTVVLVVAMAMSLTSYSKSWRVNDDVTQKAKFTDINAAMNSDEVDDGDTLYLDPGCILGNQEVTKAVTIVGTGYFFENMPYTEAYVNGKLTISAQNCKVEGLHCASVTINESNVTLERCRTGAISGYSSNVIIRSCYVESTNQTLVSGGSNWIIENSIILGMFGVNNHSYTIANLSNSILRNNYIYTLGRDSSYPGSSLSDLNRCEITNNIIINRINSNISIRNISNSTITYNIFSIGTMSEYPNNIYDATESTVFAMSGKDDRRFQLSRNSPAKGYAADGGDCGPYGSGFSYVPSGMPYGHPYFTEVRVGSVTKENKLNATYKASIQDE